MSSIDAVLAELDRLAREGGSTHITHAEMAASIRASVGEASRVPFDHVMTILRGAGDHLGRVMTEYQYCDHVQVVKAYGDVWRKMHGYVALSASPAQPSEPAGWREALQFYAEKSHFTIADEDAWDTVSGEPQNFWCDEEGTATVEDGTVAAMALAGTPLLTEDSEQSEEAGSQVSADPTGEALSRRALIDWISVRWHAEVANRPMANKNRRPLDDTWRQFLRHLGVDDRARLGPTHDELLDRPEAAAKGDASEPDDTPLETGEGDAR